MPLKIVTESATFKNIDFDWKAGSKSSSPTPQGFALDAVPATGAKDVIRNSVKVPDTDLKPGDLICEFNGGHSQVIIDASPTRILIKQGNFPGPGETPHRRFMSFIEGAQFRRSVSSGARESPNYQRVPIQDAVYELQNNAWLYKRLKPNAEWDPYT